jgi:hypothetical protein
MSYCSIQEAWGSNFNSETASPSHKPRRRRKHRDKGLVFKSGEEQRSTGRSSSQDAPSPHELAGIYEGEDVSLQAPLEHVTTSDDSLESPSTHQRQFSRSMSTLRDHHVESPRIPEPISMNPIAGAPFTREADAAVPSRYADAGEKTFAPPSSSSHEHGLLTHDASRTYDRDDDASVEAENVTSNEPGSTEMEWLRNNMSYMFDRLDQLTKKIDSVGTPNTDAESTESSLTDTMLFVAVGALSIFALDLFYRAGQRVVA